MSNVFIELNDEGIQALLKSAEMQELLASIAEEKAAQAGEGYSSRVHVMPNPKRAAANVYPETSDASRDNYYHNTLLKVVGV